jgi:hypothetical protein
MRQKLGLIGILVAIALSVCLLPVTGLTFEPLVFKRVDASSGPSTIPPYTNQTHMVAAGENEQSFLIGDVHFTQLLTSGYVNVTSSASGPSLTSNFNLGNTPIYYDISSTASYAGPIEICLYYDSNRFTDISALALLHYENGAWQDVTISRDPANRKICGRVNSLSPFAIAQPVPPVETPEPGSLVLLVSAVVVIGGFIAFRSRFGRAGGLQQ